MAIRDSELVTINNINNLIINHLDDLKRNELKNYTDTIRYPFEGKLYLTTYLIRKGMLTDSIKFDKYVTDYYDIQNQKKENRLGLDYIMINVNDTSIDYELSRLYCKEQKDMIVWHRLLYSKSDSIASKIKESTNGPTGIWNLIKDKKIKSQWYYYIKNEEYIGR